MPPFMTVVSASDLEHLLAVEKHGSDVVWDSHLDEIQKQDNACLTDLTLTDLKHLEAVEPHHSDEVLTYPDRNENWHSMRARGSRLPDARA